MLLKKGSGATSRKLGCVQLLALFRRFGAVFWITAVWDSLLKIQLLGLMPDLLGPVPWNLPFNGLLSGSSGLQSWGMVG